MSGYNEMRSPEVMEHSVETLAQAPQALSSLQEQFLARLHELVAKREQQLRIDPKDKLSLRLLSRALYSTYLDCVANGLGDQASDALDRAQSKTHIEPTVKIL